MNAIKSALRQLRSAPGTNAMGAIAIAALLVASILVARSAPRSELAVRLSDGAVWLSSTEIGGVSLLDGGSGTIATSLGVAAPGDDFSIEQWGSDAIVVNRTDGTVSRLDGSSWTITTGRVQFGQPDQPLAVVPGQSNGWVMTPGQVMPASLDDLVGAPPVPVAAPFAHGVVAEDGSLFYSSSDPNLPVARYSSNATDPVLVENLDGPTALVDLGATVAAVDLDDRRVWLESGGMVCSQLEFPTDAVLHAGGGDNQLIVVSDQGGAFVWNPEDSGCPRSADFINLGPGEYGTPTLTDGWAVVPEMSESSVVVIDLEDSRSITRSQTLAGVEPGTTVDLIAENGAIWYNDPSSANAGLIRRDGTLTPVAKYEEGSAGFTAAPVDDPSADAEDIAVAGRQQDRDDEATGPVSPGTEADQVAPSEDPAPDAPRSEEQAAPPASDGAAPTEPEQEEPTEDPIQEETDDPAPPDVGSGEGNKEDLPDDPPLEEPPVEEPPVEEPPVEEPDPIIKITMAVSAFQVKAGQTINFTAVTQHGDPVNWSSESSPGGPVKLPIEEFGSFRYRFDDPGTYYISITACDADDNCDTATAPAEILPDEQAIDLLAAFNGPATAKVGETITFNNASQGDPESYSWIFSGGDPETSVEQDGSSSWPFPGTKTVSLTITRGASSKTYTDTIVIEEVRPDPSPFGLSCSPTSLDAGQTATCSLDGEPADFDDLRFTTTAGDSSALITSEPSPGRLLVTYESGGTVQVTLRGTDKGTSEAVSATASVSFAEVDVCAQVVPNPTISGPSTVEVGDAGWFTGDGEACTTPTYSWTAQGGATISSPSGQSTNISWATPGEYDITLNFDSGGSGSSTVTKTVVVEAAAPTPGNAPSVSVSGPQTLGVGETGTYTASETTGVDHGAFSWNSAGADLGTGTGGTGNSQAVLGWSTPGTYTISASTSNVDGTGSRDLTVTVEDNTPADPAPVVSINGQTSLNTNETGSFSVANSGGSITSYSWSTTGGGGSGSSDTFSTSWQTVSTQTITLQVTGPGGSDTATLSVTISEPPPEPSPFGMGCNQSTAEVEQIFRCTLSGDPTNFSSPNWSVSSPSNYWSMDPWTHDVAGTVAGSTVTVTLSATDLATGLTVSASHSVSITEPPAPEPPPPDPSALAIGCNTSSAAVGVRVNCALSTDATPFSNPRWSTSGGAASSWGNGPFAFDIAGNEAGTTVTVTLTVFDSATGTDRSTSFSVSITA